MERVKRALSLYVNYYLRSRTPILVYSVERSGSVALLHSLQSHGLFALGAHYLSPEKLLQHRSGSAVWTSKHIISKRKPAKIITMVRSPLENMLSTFAREHYGQQGSKKSVTVSSSTPEALSQEFCQTYLQSDQYLHPLQWFEKEFQPTLGIDVYQQNFDKQKRFARFHENSYEVLILGTELEDEQKSKLVADFVGIPQLQISNRAVASETSASTKGHRLPPGKPGSQTAYAEKYKALKQHLVIPENYLEAIVNSRYSRHFFSEQERLSMRSKYANGASRK